MYILLYIVKLLMHNLEYFVTFHLIFVDYVLANCPNGWLFTLLSATNNRKCCIYIIFLVIILFIKIRYKLNIKRRPHFELASFFHETECWLTMIKGARGELSLGQSQVLLNFFIWSRKMSFLRRNTNSLVASIRQITSTVSWGAFHFTLSSVGAVN